MYHEMIKTMYLYHLFKC